MDKLIKDLAYKVAIGILTKEEAEKILLENRIRIDAFCNTFGYQLED